MSDAFVRVALPLPLHTGYTYRATPALHERLEPGMRVLVPVRGRMVIGVVTEVDVAEPSVAARDILEVPDREPVLTRPLLETVQWIASYYGAPLGLALRAAVPAGTWGSSRPQAVHERMVMLAGHVPGLEEREKLLKRSAGQRKLLELLEALGGMAPARVLKEQHGISDAVIRGLVSRGLASIAKQEVVRDPFAGVAGTPPPAEPNAPQREAVEAIAALGPGEGALLYGVTGSGKTLVYLEAVRRVLDQGRGAIVLVPEIALTPQTVARFRGVFGDDIAVLHSGLSDGERADAWRLLLRGEKRVAVGARSAIFAPVRDLGLIVIDEEHEATYKNGEAPRYHARDVARVRARLEGAALVLGSATPSLESMARVEAGNLRLLRLPERVAGRPLPPVEVIDLRSTELVPEALPVPWSTTLDTAVGVTLLAGEQVLLLLNRRGFASFLQCLSCGEVSGCPNCSIALTVHRAPVGLRCHYCDHQEAAPAACPKCGGAVQVARGVGTQQLEDVVTQRFPQARVARMDLDTTTGKWAHQKILDTVERGEVDVLLGTQMIAKGLDFPRVTLVGVIDADTAIHLPDFRSGERTFQLLAQVAGRAGRGPAGGRVLVQTRSPDHHVIRHAAAHDTDAFIADELEQRRSPPYPPHVGLVNLVVSSPDELKVADGAAELAAWCLRLIERRELPLMLLGPAPAPLARLKERWRWHVVLKGEGKALGAFVRYAARKLPHPAGTRVVIDRDPVSML